MQNNQQSEKQPWKKNSLILLAAFVLAGIFGVGLMKFERIGDFDGSPDGWLGYWGGLIGSFLGVIGAMLVFKNQLEEDKKNRKNEDDIRKQERIDEEKSRKEEKIDNTFFNLLNLFLSVKEKLEKRENYGQEVLDTLKMQYKEWQDHMVETSRISHFEKDKQYIMLELEKTPGYVDQKISYDLIESLKDCKYQAINEIFLQDRLDQEDFDYLRYQYNDEIIRQVYNPDSTEGPLDPNDIDVKYNIDRYNEYQREIFLDKFKENIENNQRLLSIRNILQNETCDRLPYKSEKDSIVFKAYNCYYPDYGNLFRIFHRIVKYINRNVSNEDEKRNYIGFLRAMVNETEMVLIFYNAFYTKRGKGLGDELITTNFFGDPDDFETDEEYTQHFNKEQLIWGEDDINKMKECKLKVSTPK